MILHGVKWEYHFADKDVKYVAFNTDGIGSEVHIAGEEPYTFTDSNVRMELEAWVEARKEFSPIYQHGDLFGI